MDLGDIFDILIDGKDEEIRNLIGSHVWYKYTPDVGGFRVKRGEEIVSACKVFFLPNCVKLYGNEHTF